jgi:predicted XRE-type DNA-binding protein
LTQSDQVSTETFAGAIAMTDKPDLVRGSSNVFRDLDLPDADTERLRAALAAEIIATPSRQHLTNGAASKLTGVQEADISRIRNADLKRFTLDRLVEVLNGLGYSVSMAVALRNLEPV